MCAYDLPGYVSRRSFQFNEETYLQPFFSSALWLLFSVIERHKTEKQLSEEGSPFPSPGRSLSKCRKNESRKNIFQWYWIHYIKLAKNICNSCGIRNTAKIKEWHQKRANYCEHSTDKKAKWSWSKVSKFLLQKTFWSRFKKNFTNTTTEIQSSKCQLKDYVAWNEIQRLRNGSKISITGDTYVSRKKIRDKKILQKGFVFMSGFLGCDNNEET